MFLSDGVQPVERFDASGRFRSCGTSNFSDL